MTRTSDTEIILCIGLEKTGTTMLQQVCATNRDTLIQQRVLYPYLLGRVNHIYLAAYAQNDDKACDVRRAICDRQGLSLAELRQRVEDEVDFIAKRRDFRRLLVSNEHLHSRITEPAELERLKTLLDRIGARYRIAVILRRQDRLAESLLSTMMKGGRMNIEPVLPVNLPLSYRYYDLLDMYEQVFGPGTVHVGIYEDQTAADVSLFDIFEQVTGLGRLLPRPDDGVRANPALNREGLRVLGRLNALTREQEPLSFERRQALIRQLETQYSGRPVLLTRTRAEAFLALCADQNEQLRQRWRPDRANLFPTDLSGLPDTLAGDQMSVADVDRAARDLLAQ